MHPNGTKRTKIFSLGSNGVDRVRSLQKNSTRLRGTNFCTSSAHFVPSFVMQPNCPECTQIVQNALKRQFRIQQGGSGAFFMKNFDATSCTNFWTSSARFAPSFVRQSNGPECNQIVRNATKRQFRVQWGGSRLRKMPTRLHGMTFCTSLARFAPSFVRQPNGPKCTQIVRNAPKFLV